MAVFSYSFSFLFIALMHPCLLSRDFCVSAFAHFRRCSAPHHLQGRPHMTSCRQSSLNEIDGNDNDSQGVSRRRTLRAGLRSVSLLLLLDMLEPRPADALFGGKERRQLDYCLVNLLRVTYWAEATLSGLLTTDDEDKRKKVYLEARLGAKALVTGKVGGGSTNRVFQLSTLQFRGCLDDIAYYGKSRQVSDLCQDLLESIAAVVEFDGLETTTDPSPRSSLTLSMYNPKKAIYVERLLSERVIPISKQLFRSFDPTIRQRCEAYVAETYPNEVPKPNVE